MAALVAAPGTAFGSSAHVESLQRISGQTPFSTQSCGVPGEETPSSEAEPYVAVNPRNPLNIVATWQQDRFPVDGGALSNLVGATKDGGATWRTVRLPRISRCTGGRDERTSDPWVSIGGDGRVYHSSLTFTETAAGTIGAAGPTALAAQTSANGGLSFADPVSIIDRQLYDDREAITADPRRPGHAYVTWVFRYGSMGESGIEYFARTTDGGSSWSEPAPIHTPPSGFIPDPTMINVLPDGTLLNTFLLINGSFAVEQSAPGTPLVPFEAYAMRSTDLGRTWSEPVRIGVIDNPVMPEDPKTGALIRSLPIVSTDVARDGTTYVVWNEIESHQEARIFISLSRDGGRTWSPPGTVKRVGSQAFLPNVAVAPGGTVAVTWDDFRNDRGADDDALATDVWLAHSHDRGATWSETHVAGPFDMLSAPPTGSAGIAGRFVGDYQGLAALPTGFAAVFAQAKPQARVGPSDTFFARVRVGRPLKLRLSMRPRRARVGRRTRFRFRVTVREGRRLRPIRGATIRFAGRRVRTNSRGRARMRVRFRRSRLRRARVRKAGFRSGAVRVRVRPRGARRR